MLSLLATGLTVIALHWHDCYSKSTSNFRLSVWGPLVCLCGTMGRRANDTKKGAEEPKKRSKKTKAGFATRSLLGSQFVTRENKNLLVGSERSVARGILPSLGSFGQFAALNTWTGVRGDQPRKSGCCHGHREQLCEWQPRSAHKCEGGGWRMIQGMVVGNEREYFVGRQKLCYLLWTWSCRCRCQMYCFEL